MTCKGSGYNGRIGSYELLVMNRPIQEAIKLQKSDNEIEEIALQEGMLTLMNYGVELIKRELTTTSEVIRVCKK